ncbi:MULTISPECIES: DMT family transporter [unclassified Paludibacterium]|uniref:DMT family transporter n=1 Tax=unclassified Paludibacterium TaxID=2618429 RepID=UPI001C054157|nr:DMT family transporter [Paludibacterium sp. B53371]BEV70874.1 hypothetical protein THUN1379_03560 [Paludibacterium sp. THUN1379]
MWMAMMLALLAGVARTLSRLLNARLAGQIGVLPGTLVNYLGGLAAAVLACLSCGVSLPWPSLAWVTVPGWAWLGGAVGVGFVVLCNRVTPHVSAFAMTLLMFAGQMSAGLLLDAWLHAGLSGWRVLGAVLAGLGLLGTLWVDRHPRAARPCVASAPSRETA